MANPSLKPVTSSLIAGYEYDPHAMVLTVQFVKDPDVDHQYFNVTPDVMSAIFDSGGSVGSKFVKRIVRGGFKHAVKSQESANDL